MSGQLSPIRALVLDWAGTVIDHGCFAPVTVLIEAFARSGIAVTEAQARVPMGMPKWNHIDAVLGLEPVAAQWRAMHGRAHTPADVDQLYGVFLPLQVDFATRHVDLVPGALSAIEWARRAGMRIGSTTGYPREIMDRVAPLVRAAGYAPDCIVDASSGVPGRPAPWIVFEAMRQLDVYPPSTVVVVDDTAVGIRAGISAGTWTIGVAASGNGVGLSASDLSALRAREPAEAQRRIDRSARELREAGAHVVIDSLADLVRGLAALPR